MDFSQLGPDILAEQCKDLSYLDILSLCLVNKETSQHICQNDDFWQKLYFLRYPHDPVNKGNISWKQYIINKEFRNKVWLDQITWIASLNHELYLYNDNSFNAIRRQINEYLAKQKIVWTTDPEGWVYLKVNTNSDYLKFRPNQYTRGSELIKALEDYYNADSGLTIDEYKLYFINHKYPSLSDNIKASYFKTFDNDVILNYIKKMGYVANKNLNLSSLFSSKIRGVRLVNQNKLGHYVLIWNDQNY